MRQAARQPEVHVLGSDGPEICGHAVRISWGVAWRCVPYVERERKAAARRVEPGSCEYTNTTRRVALTARRRRSNL